MAEFIVGIAMALNIKWVPNGIVYVGAACRVQGPSNLGTSHTSPINYRPFNRWLALLWFNNISHYHNCIKAAFGLVGIVIAETHVYI
jgi:hypothetical protein